MSSETIARCTSISCKACLSGVVAVSCTLPCHRRFIDSLQIAMLQTSVAIDSKLPWVGTTIFTVMSRLAADCGAINLSQGFPDFQAEPALFEATLRAMRDGTKPVPADGRNARAAYGHRRQGRGPVRRALRHRVRKSR